MENSDYGERWGLVNDSYMHVQTLYCDNILLFFEEQKYTLNSRFF